MDSIIMHRDSSGYRAWNLHAEEFSAVAAMFVARLDPPGGHDAVVRLTSALSIASDGIWGNEVLWLIEDPAAGKIALAHSSPTRSSPPQFDGLVWFHPDGGTRPVPFSIREEAICSIVEFCGRFLGYPFSLGARATSPSHR